MPGNGESVQRCGKLANTITSRVFRFGRLLEETMTAQSVIKCSALRRAKSSGVVGLIPVPASSDFYGDVDSEEDGYQERDEHLSSCPC